jgi:hypothetical protein
MAHYDPFEDAITPVNDPESGGRFAEDHTPKTPSVPLSQGWCDAPKNENVRFEDQECSIKPDPRPRKRSVSVEGTPLLKGPRIEPGLMTSSDVEDLEGEQCWKGVSIPNRHVFLPNRNSGAQVVRLARHIIDLSTRATTRPTSSIDLLKSSQPLSVDGKADIHRVTDHLLPSVVRYPMEVEVSKTNPVEESKPKAPSAETAGQKETKMK